MNTCKNCQHPFEGTFCPECGQKVIIKRFNLKDSFIWLLHSIFNLDHGFLHTTKELIVNPGRVIQNVLNGITVKYTHPFRLLFIWATISTLLVIFLGTYDEQNSEIYESLEFSETQRAFQEKINAIMKKYLNFIIMANIPFVSFFSWLFYKKKRLNFTEHLVINSYGYSMTTALGIIFVFVQYIIHEAALMMWLSMLLNVSLMAYAYCSTFQENYLKSFLKYLLGFILSYVFLIIFFVILGIALALISKFVGSDFFTLPSKQPA